MTGVRSLSRLDCQAMPNQTSGSAFRAMQPMTPGDILVFVEHGEGASALLDYAAALAAQGQAHLDVCVR